jgi:cell division protein FtsI/penicillin-binding protein 2
MERNTGTTELKIDHRYITILIVIGVAFFFVYAYFSLTSPTRFVSPDETANYLFAQRFSEKSSLTLAEPLNDKIGGIVHPVKKWSKVSIAQIPMGQGIAVTSLQMMMAMCAIANKGVLMRPMVVDRLEDRDRAVVAKYSPQRVRRVISEAAAETPVAEVLVCMRQAGLDLNS